MVESLIDIIIQTIRILAGLVLTFFIPGYAAVLAIFPNKNDLTWMEKIGYSGVFSILIVVSVVLFMDLALKIPTTAVNITLFLLAFTGMMISLWQIEVYINKKRNFKSDRE